MASRPPNFPAIKAFFFFFLKEHMYKSLATYTARPLEGIISLEHNRDRQLQPHTQW